MLKGAGVGGVASVVLTAGYSMYHGQNPFDSITQSISSTFQG
jgi:hypothetical protein